MTEGGARRPAGSPIRESFARQVHAQPAGIAVRYGRERLSYAELNRAANRLTHHLRSLGVTRGTVVGVCLDRGPDLVTALLAVLKAGAAYVSLAPAEARACRVLITTRRLGGDLPEPECLLCLDVEHAFIARRSPLNPVVPARPDDPALVCQGVSVPHRTITSVAESLPLRPTDAMLHWSPSSSPGAALELWAPLCRGATTVPFPAPEPTSAELAAVIERESVTAAYLPASLLDRMPHTALPALAGLRLLITCGHNLSRATTDRLARALPEVRLVFPDAPTDSAA